MHDFTIYVNPAVPQLASVSALQAWCQGLTDYPVVHGQKFRLLDKFNAPLAVPNPTDPYDSADISAFVTVGQIAHSNASDVHRSLTIEIQEAKLREAGVQLATLNSRIQAFFTYCDPRTIDPKTGKPTPLVVAPQFLGTLDIPDNQRQTSGNILKIVCLDLTQEIAKRGFPVPFAFPANTNLADDLRAFFMMDNRSPDDGGRQPSGTLLRVLPPTDTSTVGDSGSNPTGPFSYIQAQSWTWAERTIPDTEVCLEDAVYAVGPGVSSGAAVVPPVAASFVDYGDDISGYAFPAGSWTADVALSGQPYPSGALSLKCTVYELHADGSRTTLGTMTGTPVTLGTAHTAPETDNISCSGSIGAFTAGQGSRLSVQFWLTVTSPLGAASTSGGTTGATITEIFVITTTNLATTTPTVPGTFPKSSMSSTAIAGNGLGYTALGYPVEDARSGCYQTGETATDGSPLYAHAATVHASNGSGGFIRYVGGQGLKIEPGTGVPYSPAVDGLLCFADLVGGRIVWHFGDGASFDWLETNPTTGSIWDGNPAAPTLEGTILGGDVTGTVAAASGDPNANNPVAMIAGGTITVVDSASTLPFALGTPLGETTHTVTTGLHPFWPDPQAPGLSPAGCPCPGANWPASKMQIASSDYVLPQALSYYTDANQMGAGKAIAALLRFEDPSADENGNLIMRPLPYSTSAIIAPEFLFDTSNPNIIVDPITQRIASKDQLANMVVIVSKNNTLTTPIIAVAKNTSLDSQISIPNLGETIFVKVIQDDRIMTQAEADARAYVEINAIALAADTIDVTLGAPFAFFRNNDLIGLNAVSKDGRVEIDANFYPYIVSAWNLDLFSGAMNFTAARRVRL